MGSGKLGDGADEAILYRGRFGGWMAERLVSWPAYLYRSKAILQVVIPLYIFPCCVCLETRHAPPFVDTAGEAPNCQDPEAVHV